MTKLKNVKKKQNLGMKFLSWKSEVFEEYNQLGKLFQLQR